MAAKVCLMVERWTGEVAKLRDKVRLPSRKPFRSEAKPPAGDCVDDDTAAEEKLEASKPKATPPPPKEIRGLSEDTVFMLMDRFAPA